MACQVSEVIPSAASQPESWGKTVNGLKSSLSCSEKYVAEGRPVRLILRVRNVSESLQKYSVSSCCGPTFKVIASFKTNSPLEFADLVQQEHHPCGVADWIELRPGEVKQHQFALKVGQFLRNNYLFLGPELGVPLKQYGELSLRLDLKGLVSNPITINIIE